jgi:uncharacterized protein involved in exopolysaccharide biosynthesis
MPSPPHVSAYHADARGLAVTAGEFAVTPAAGPVSLVRLLAVPLRHRRTIARWALAAGIALAVLTLVRPRLYRSSASFLPQGSRTGNNFAGVAAQFGIALPTGGDGVRSPGFYADLVRSRSILGQLVDKRYTAAVDGRRQAVTLVELYGNPGNPAPLRRDEAIRRLREQLATELADKTGVVTVSAVTRDAGLSQQIVQQALAEVSRFNLETRQSQAKAERQFAEARLREARAELRRAEDRLQLFLEGNRELTFSPRLQTERGRLLEATAVQRQLVTSLTQAYEQARLDEVRDTPVITVMDTPERAARPEPRRLAVLTLLGLITGAAIGVIVGYVREYLAAVRREDADGSAQFDALRSAAVQDIRSPVAGLLLGRGRRG